jgi:hypothetical protein
VANDPEGTAVISWGGLEKLDALPESKDFNLRVRTKGHGGALVNDSITAEVRGGKPFRFFFYPAFSRSSAGEFRDVPK